jgi:dTDP-4-dehydrorhamnose reductase
MKNTIKIDKNTKKILIIGANGFLGSKILQLRDNIQSNNHNYSFLAADLEKSNIDTSIPFYYLDITNQEGTMKNIQKLSPEIVILTAAMTNVDQNEENMALASNINTQGPINVLNACDKIKAKLIFLSTDFIFDGITKNGNYNEEDLPNPLSHYGKTKLKAELALIDSNIEFLICRTAVLYGWNKEKLNFITWILKMLEQNEEISIVTNQINNATYVRNLAEIILKLIEKDASGIYHTTGDNSLSRYEMALSCAEIFDYEKKLITPIKELTQKAIRPKNAGLDISKLKKLIGNELKIFNLTDGLFYMKNNRLL